MNMLALDQCSAHIITVGVVQGDVRGIQATVRTHSLR